MSVESDFRAALANNAALTALVSTRIAQDAVPQGSAYPLVVFSVQRQREFALDNTKHVDACTVQVQCWAGRAVDASSVADAVETALANDATALACDATVVQRETAFDPDIDLHAVQLAVEWWVV